jgi:hypothetical protein
VLARARLLRNDKKLYVDEGINYDVENKPGVQILSSLPITSPMGSNEGLIEIDSNWTKFIVSYFHMNAVQKTSFFFTALSPEKCS